MNNADGRISDLATWAGRFRAAAAITLGAWRGTEAGAFRDELGHRREIDGPFMAWRAAREGRGGGEGSPRADGPGAAEGTEVVLWEKLVRGDHDLRSILKAARRDPLPIATPIVRRPAALEVATESELCALHALWWHAGLHGSAAAAALCVESARWMIEHIQPDNATNLPWGAHVFVSLGPVLGEDSVHYGATLLHNCQVALGRPDARSAHILADGAEALVTLGDSPLRALGGAPHQTGAHRPDGLG
ncbi:MAG: hypothetical protein ACT4PL_09770 [Phycisphaerales bacterium]